jgi:Icc-related predicted phosphoesterase
MKRQSGLKIYFASDIHGSERCFRKFLGAVKYYGAQVLILGGDVTGKAMVPVIAQAGGQHQAMFHGVVRDLADDELNEFEKGVRFDGFYPYRCDPDEYTRLEQDAVHRDQIFHRLMVEQLEMWVALAGERLTGTGTRVFMMPGNDDEFGIDPALESDFVTNVDGRVVDIDGIEMISCGWVSRTPWDSPREEDESSLEARIEKMCAEVHDPSRAIFNLHCPPYGSKLDLAPKITAELKMVTRAGDAVMESCGSVAVRNIIEKYQHMLSLHGHIHESRAVDRIGRTVSVNPGSRYSEGSLDGVLIEIAKDNVKQCQLVVG